MFRHKSICVSETAVLLKLSKRSGYRVLFRDNACIEKKIKTGRSRVTSKLDVIRVLSMTSAQSTVRKFKNCSGLLLSKHVIRRLIINAVSQLTQSNAKCEDIL